MAKRLPPLFIGRFQPFHLGHLDAFSQVFTKEPYVIIGIGSTEDDYVPDNPFTAGERYQMIEAALLGQRVSGRTLTRENFSILPVRNIHHYSLWVKHVESLLPPFGDVYTGSPIVRRLFKEDGRHDTIPIRKHKKISATDIRKRMATGRAWDHLVPVPVAALIRRWDAEGRIKEIQHP